MKRCFAQKFIDNITLVWTIDVEHHVCLVYSMNSLICVPMCTQKYETSFTYEPRANGRNIS